MMYLLRHFRKEESGQTTIEYALMLVLVALAVAAASPGISQAVTGVFSKVAGALAGQ
jgi:Flp pilus assembly pilin Flp